MFNFVDLCSGIGGFRSSFEDLGGKCVLSSELDDKTANIYKSIYKLNNNSSEVFVKDLFDITSTIRNAKMKVDVLSAGFPCQPFSSAGRSRGFHDERGNVFFGISNAIDLLKPNIVFLENVKNIINHNKGNTLKVIIDTLERKGYSVSYKILNNKDYGLPQNRQRFYLIASKKKKFIFDSVYDGGKGASLRGFITQTDYVDPESYTITPESSWKHQAGSNLKFCGFFRKNLRKVENKKIVNVNHSRYHRQCNRIYHIDGTTPTISAQESSGRYYVYDGTGVFKISQSDILKLQGFPVKILPLFLNQSIFYKCLGNSVTPVVVREITRGIFEQNLL